MGRSAPPDRASESSAAPLRLEIRRQLALKLRAADERPRRAAAAVRTEFAADDLATEFMKPLAFDNFLERVRHQRAELLFKEAARTDGSVGLDKSDAPGI